MPDDPLAIISVVVDHEADEVRIESDLDDAWTYWWLCRAVDIADPNAPDDEDDD